MKILKLELCIYLGLVLLSANSYKKNEEPEKLILTKPIVKTIVVNNITLTTASSGGIITNNGGDRIITRGVCWGTNQNPSISDNIIEENLLYNRNDSSFISNITGLKANTTYYVRAYATKSIGVGYGNEESFSIIIDSDNSVIDIDGNIYSTIIVGTQVWIKENLKVTHYRNGDPILNVPDPTQWSSLTTGAYCNYKNDVNNGDIYGRLYNWYAVNDIRGLAPNGWHIATDDEWTVLTTFLGGESYSGGMLKEIGTSHWNNPNLGASDIIGFAALPGGNLGNNTFWDIGINGLWWCSTEKSASTAMSISIKFNSISLNRGLADNKFIGFQV